MHILVGPRSGGELTVRLQRPSDCGAIGIESAIADPTATRTALLASRAAAAVDGDEFLISVAWLRANSGALPDDPRWTHDFDALVSSLQSGETYLSGMDAVRVRVTPATSGEDSRRTPMAWITGVGLTPFGRLPGRSAVGWQAAAATAALADAGRAREDVDGLVVGYATTIGHLMPANLLAEHLGLRPATAFGMSVGGATGLAMVAQATALIGSGAARCVLVVAGEDRASGQSRQRSTDILAQVGQRDYEVPLGATVPGYYALLASAYLHRHGLSGADLAPLAVQMRRHAATHPGAQYRDLIDEGDVLASRPIAEPLRLLDCCPVSDGGAAIVVEARERPRAVAITGLGQAHLHQHVCEVDLDDVGAGRSSRVALATAGIDLDAIDIAGVYDSFTITLAILLEEIGFAPPGGAGAMARAAAFGSDGSLPLNTHGGLLSYGHSGVAGGMAHLVEVVTQLRGEAGSRQVDRPLRRGLVHADGGVLSAHVTAVLDTMEPVLT